MHKEMTIEEKETRWINAVNRKNIDSVQTDEEYWYEIETYQPLYEDEILEFSVEYGNEYGIHFKDADGNEIPGGLSCGYLDMILDYPFESLHSWNKAKGKIKAKTLREYLREKGFPINFKTWD